MLPIKRTPVQMMERCEKLESFGLKCLEFDRKVIHESFPDVVFDFSSIDLVSDRSARSVMWYVIQVTSSLKFKEGKADMREQFKDLLFGE